MTQKDKELLLIDLCARLPYGIICEDAYGNALELNSIDKPNTATFKCSDNTFWTTDLDKCKPYLFPLSNMTEEQWNNGRAVNLTEFTFESFKCGGFTLASYTCENDLHNLVEFIHWLIENHFDIYGLIPMGLAIDATNLNIY